jgi:hypothetical protein
MIVKWNTVGMAMGASKRQAEANYRKAFKSPKTKKFILVFNRRLDTDPSVKVYNVYREVKR